MSTNKYIALLEEADGNFGVIFPDFVGCVSCGKTKEEALLAGREALELHLEGMAEDGDKIPLQSDLDKVNEWLDECEGLCHLNWIEATLPSSKAVRVNITIQENLLKAVDKKLAGKKHWRSRFIADAVQKQLQEA
ncbi:MAG: type II toxin-antitoxin system HicB family antitoxin [Victivallaceae bacterium]|nr:type II toxin-antitoxin system HicB family antitoxin [Victivallaceae bacterium]